MRHRSLILMAILVGVLSLTAVGTTGLAKEVDPGDHHCCV